MAGEHSQVCTPAAGSGLGSGSVTETLPPDDVVVAETVAEVVVDTGLVKLVWMVVIGVVVILQQILCQDLMVDLQIKIKEKFIG